MNKRKIVTFSIIGIFLTPLIITNYLNNDGIIIASNTTEEQFKKRNARGGVLPYTVLSYNGTGGHKVHLSCHRKYRGVQHVL